MGSYVVLAGIVVSVLLGSLLVGRRVLGSVVRCGFCDHRVMPWAVGRDTFTCRPCKKTLPRRLAYPTPALEFTTAAPIGNPECRVPSGGARVLEPAGRHRKAG